MKYLGENKKFCHQNLYWWGMAEVLGWVVHPHLFIVFVWSQYDGGNIDKEQRLRLPQKPNEAKLNIAKMNIMRSRLSLDPNNQHLDLIIHI